MPQTANKTHRMVKVAMIAAIYTVLTLVIAPVAFGAIQFRVSEVLTILPAFTPLAIPGLTLGCALSNLIGALLGINPTGYIDALIGTSATLIASVLSYMIGKSSKPWVRYAFVPLPPILANALIVGAEITVLFNAKEAFMVAFAANAVSVGVGELVVCYVLGIPLMVVLSKNNLYKKIGLTSADNKLG